MVALPPLHMFGPSFELRAILILLDLVSVLLLAMGFPAKALACVDPSVTIHTIQALVGVAVALSAALGVVLRRTRCVAMCLLSLDENVNRIIEFSVHRIAVDDAQRRELLTAANSDVAIMMNGDKEGAKQRLVSADCWSGTG